jgi:hypothetical protein
LVRFESQSTKYLSIALFPFPLDHSGKSDRSRSTRRSCRCPRLATKLWSSAEA